MAIGGTHRGKLSDEHEQGSCSLENFKSSSLRPKNTGELVVPFLVRVDELSLEN